MHRPTFGDNVVASRQPSALCLATCVAICTIVTGIGCSLAFLLGYIGPHLVRSLDLSRGQLGLMIGLFFGGTGLGSAVLGRCAVRFSPRELLSCDLLLVSAAYFVMSASDSVALIIVASAASGVGYALVNIGTNIAIAAVSPGHRIGLHMSIKTAGVPLMATLMAVGTPFFASRYGHKPVCAFMAILSLMTVLAVLLFFPKVHSVALGHRGRAEGQLPREFMWLPVAAFLVIAGSQPLLSWLVVYLDEIDPSSQSLSVGLASAVGTGVGAVVLLLVAAWSDRARSRWRARFASIACIFCAVGTAVVWLGASYSIGIAAIGAVIGISGNLVAASLSHTLVVDRAPEAVGRGTGLTMTGYYSGALVAPFVFGSVSESSGGFAAAWAVCVVTLLLGAFCFRCFKPDENLTGAILKV